MARPWRQLIASARSRDLQSSLYQVIANVLERLSQRGVLNRPDAFEYLANAREGWHVLNGSDSLESEDVRDEALLEKLDAIVFGLVEALDADRTDLPRLLEEALNGSLWARRIARLSAEVTERHHAQGPRLLAGRRPARPLHRQTPPRDASPTV